MSWFISYFVCFQKEYNERVARREAGEIDTDDYQMYLDVATRDKKGRVFGTGNAAPTFFRAPENKSKASQSTYIPGPLAQYASQQSELTKTLEEVKKEQAWFKEQMLRQFGWTYPDQGCNQGVPPQRRDGHDDDGSGGSFGNQVPSIC